MAGIADLAHLDQERITVTVVIYALDELKMAGGHPLNPKLLAGPRPETRLAGLKGLFQRILVHIGHHQYVFCFIILDDGRDQSVSVEF